MPPYLYLRVVVADDVSEMQRFALKKLTLNIRRVNRWAMTKEPKPLTPIYQNTPETDVLPAETNMVLDHGWRDVPVAEGDTVGLYLGNAMVAVVRVLDFSDDRNQEAEE